MIFQAWVRTHCLPTGSRHDAQPSCKSGSLIQNIVGLGRRHFSKSEIYLSVISGETEHLHGWSELRCSLIR